LISWWGVRVRPVATGPACDGARAGRAAAANPPAWSPGGCPWKPRSRHAPPGNPLLRVRGVEDLLPGVLPGADTTSARLGHIWVHAPPPPGSTGSASPSRLARGEMLALVLRVRLRPGPTRPITILRMG